MTPRPSRRADRPRPPPLDAATLERLALAYVGRYATSRAALCRYLRRKLAERGWAGPETPDEGALADRLVALGYVDDRGIAEARGRALGRRGYGARRVAGALGVLGIDEADAAPALADAAATAWQTALRFAERRRIGPFATRDQEEPDRRRAFAAMMRAGHSADIVREIIAAPRGQVPVRSE